MLPYTLIQEADDRLRKRVRRTELIHSHHFSEKLGVPIYFKCENLQRTGAFKIRGALNFMTSQPREALAKGVITASAGNHAQGVAFSADLLGVPSTVFMPESTPPQKVFATRDYGAEVVLTGRNFDEAYAAAVQAQEERGALFVHPFDDPLVMAGQGTIGLEVLQELPDVANILIPIGGGGLIAGIATAIRETHPHVRIIGVETAAAPSAHYSLQKGKIVQVPVTVTLADGIAVKKPGVNTFPIIRDLVDEVVLVEEEEIALAIVALLERTKLLVEGAGAVPLAALLNRRVADLSGKTVCVLSGGNIDVKTISVVVERGLVAAGRYLKLKVELDDLPGALARLATEIAEAKANISIITHDRRSKSLPIGKTEVLIELETRGFEHIQEVISHLQGVGYLVDVLK
ncbi:MULTISPECIES: threonine ammonia-lyase [Geobacter]|uniref:threonine ammonia-lyase n=1 Tax=Geobacter TaxID=28231 RepID=UPI0025743486|nr:threonine ammonia-lyase [Geobacter sulfurreducens]BEH08839.1 threonine ammonia-lyase [Geobacter sulfurreducens subsp. ethanolicus]BET60339.1 threonine ammonia-lyase [Geobacter sp. 60473]HML77747.1 threonine ammonia-lyase [Geobacter sulfurreducens]